MCEMKRETGDLTDVFEALKAIRQDLALLSGRVSALEAASSTSPQTAATPSAVQAEGLSEELVLVISAAIAAYLGKKPHIAQIRLLGTAAWAQQGRVTIQASHALATRHTRSEH
jgi:methylmalonyl-CoA carboxyltransferase large subunit